MLALALTDVEKRGRLYTCRFCISVCKRWL